MSNTYAEIFLCIFSLFFVLGLSVFLNIVFKDLCIPKQKIKIYLESKKGNFIEHITRWILK
jgi:hypothetical protein